jgi:hypothetical protein
VPLARLQKKFTDLSGTTEAQGDLKSIVLHKLTLASQSNDFPLGMICII